MNNKGFTLMELIVTIALLAVISVISFVSINVVILESEVKNCENLVSSIKSATKEYVSDNRYNLTSDNLNITGDILTGEKYLSTPIVNPFTDTNIDASTINISITLNDDYSAGEITVKNGSNVVDCSSGKW